ncbi:MAG: hypothetical protein K2Q26_08540 [Bdellovibrionales bacterium]|nr:hypothetical protein [Bdellovibrionales bacterium]
MILSLIASLVVSAHATPPVPTIINVNPETSACYTREYSVNHMKAHPGQKVQKFDFKFSQDKDSMGNGEFIALNVKANLLTANGLKPYSTGMTCMKEASKLNCFIECDGGSAEVTWNKNEILFKNKGFVLYGGCGSEVSPEETVWLTPKKGGDDVFKLTAVACQ